MHDSEFAKVRALFWLTKCLTIFFSTLFVCHRGGRDGTVCWHGRMCHIWKSGWNCDETIDVINLYCTCATKPTRPSEEKEGFECVWTYYNLYSA